MRHFGKKLAAILFTFAMVFALTFVVAGCNDEEDSARETVIRAIDALPTESELSVGDIGAVEDARTLYDALSESEQPNVTNYGKLEAAEKVVIVLKQIVTITPSFTSGTTATVGEAYTPAITGYGYAEVETSVAYSLKDNTAEAAIADGVITAAKEGAFTVEATVSYAGYNIKRNAVRTVTVVDPEKFCLLSGQLNYAEDLTDSRDFAGAKLKIGANDIEVNADGSWSAELPYGTYDVSATHPLYAASPVKGFVVNEATMNLDIEYVMWKAKGNGANADANVYDWEHNAYISNANSNRTGNSRIDFDAIEAKANEEFVFRTKILYSEHGTGNWKFGLTVHDGVEIRNKEVKAGTFSYGLLLANDGNGRFIGIGDMDINPNPTSYKSQGAVFGSVPVLPTQFGVNPITLTYVRKSVENKLQWYMIAEWGGKRFVRQPSEGLAEELAKLDNTTIQLGLSLGFEGTNAGAIWDNVYFSTDSAKVNAIDLEDGTTDHQRVTDAINALPNSSALALENADAVEEARALYNALTSAAKAQVNEETLDKLTAAETTLQTLRAIDNLQITATSAASVDLNEGVFTYTPMITGYEYTGVTTTVSYNLKAGATNTAEAQMSGNDFTGAKAGTFTVEAIVSYENYNIVNKIEWTVTVIDPTADTNELHGTLTFDKLTKNIDCSEASVKFTSSEKGEFSAVANADGSWTLRVPYGTYTVTAAHPAFVTKTIENAVVGESTSAPDIEFTAWKTKGNGANADANVYDSQNNAYISNINGWQTGNSRIDFDGIEAKSGEQFVFSAEIMYSEHDITQDWKMGLTVHDGLEIRAKKVTAGGTFSYGLFLANDQNGRFIGYSALETTNTSKGSQGAVFGSENVPVLPTAFGEYTIRLTYVRKEVESKLQWYMIVEWGDKRFVRQPSDALAAELAKLDTSTVELGLSLGPSATTGLVKWGNVYFSTDAETVQNTDLVNDGITDPSAAIAAINALPAASELTLDDASKVEEARALFNALTNKAEAQAGEEIYTKLTTAETTLLALKDIYQLQITATSDTSLDLGEPNPYTPSITGYGYKGINTTVTYALKEGADNTAGAVKDGDGFTVVSAGTFTVEATVTYSGYTAVKKYEWTVTVIDPTAGTQLMSVTLKYDKLTSSITDSDASVTFTLSENESSKITAEKNEDGSWKARVPYGTYNVTASYPAFLDAGKSVTVSETTTETAFEIEFKLWKAKGSIAHTNDGNETEILSNFSYDMENEIYQTKGGLIRSGISRINFEEIKVEAGVDFVFAVDLLYTGCGGAATSFSPANAYHHGLGIYDGSSDIKDSEYSYGLLLSNAVVDNGNQYKGHFGGFSAIDTAPTKYTEENTGNVYCGRQGDYITSGSLSKPDGTGQNKIRLTYVRKNNVWYMIAEIYKSGTLNSRSVRQATGDMLDNLNSINSKTIYLGLVNQVTSPKSGTTAADYDQIVKWGNVFFATGTGVADTVDLTAAN